MMRIGIFGGTFNPPHKGHKKLALEFMSRLSLDIMLIIPTCAPPHKITPDLADGEDRLNMCKLCFDEDKFIVSDIELLRKGKSYTVDTLKEIRSIYPDDELFFVMGSDMLLTFHQWKEPEKILEYATICSAIRGDELTKELQSYVDERYPDKKNRFAIIDFAPIEISSSRIRKDLKSNLPNEWLDSDVYNYIKERGLYL